MCTFKDERTVLVCDAAIGRVKQDLEQTFGTRVRYTLVEGQGTLVEARPEVDASRFAEITRSAIAEVQKVTKTQESQAVIHCIFPASRLMGEIHHRTERLE